jgi:hypothetical protein
MGHSGGMAQKRNTNTDTSDAYGTNDRDDSPRHVVRLPYFIVRTPIGAGQVAKRITSGAGVKPCAGCEQRAARLDRWLRIEPRR